MKRLLLSLALLLPGSAMAQSAAQTYFQEAEKAIQAGDLGTAREKILAGLAVEPDHANAMVNLANVYMLEKNWTEATKWFDRALKIDPTNAVGLNGRGLAYLEIGDFEKAIGMFVAAAKADPTNPTPISNLGDASFIMRDVVTAEKYYLAVLDVNAAHSHALSKLAEIAAETGRADAAFSYAERAMKADPKNPRVHVAAGRAFLAKRDYYKAIGFLYDAAQALPRDVAVRYHLGSALLATGQYRPAAETFLEALDLDDSDARLHLQLGIAYYMIKQPELVEYAKKEFTHVLERKPGNVEKASALYHLALLEDDAERLDVAQKGYLDALKADPTHAFANNNLGLIFARKGKFGEAVPYYQRALKRDPDFKAARLNLGYALVQTGKKAEGRAELQKLMTLPDNDPVKAQAREILQGKN